VITPSWAWLVFAGSQAPAGLFAHLGQFLVDFRGGDFAVRHIDQVEARALFQETDGGFFFWRAGLRTRRFDRGRCGDRPSIPGLEMRRDFRPIPEFPRRADDGVHGKFDAGHVFQQFLDLLALPFQLLGVGKVLVLAAAALAEKRAFRIDAVRRGRENLQQVGLGIILVVAEDAGADLLARQREGHHDDPAAGRRGNLRI
jgi:hypothetical protein